MTTSVSRSRARSSLAGLVLLSLLLPAGAPGQSLSQGGLRGAIVEADGGPVTSAALTLEDEAGGVVRRFRSDIEGRFHLSLVLPGHYALLVEKAGFQPLRQRGVVVRARQETDVRVVVTRRPPPITQVEEAPTADQRFAALSPQVVDPLGARDLAFDGPRLDLAEAGRFGGDLVSPRSARWGLAEVLGSFPPAYGRLAVDGTPLDWMRHPGVETEPIGSALVPPYLQEEVQFLRATADPEVAGSYGGTVNVMSQSPTRRFRLEPFVTWGAPMGIPTDLNPGDSSGRVIQAGAVVSGTLIKDRAQFLLGGGFEDLRLPAGRPWERDSATLGGVAVPLAATLTAIAQDTFGFDAGRSIRPVVRTRRGGTGSLQTEWQLTTRHQLSTRTVVSGHEEESPEFGRDVLTGGGGELKSRDLLAQVALTSTWERIANEFRITYQSATRDWSDASPAITYLVGDGAGLGGSPAWPGRFRASTARFAETFHWQFGPSGRHRVKGGAHFATTLWNQTFLYGEQGIFTFGDLDAFADRQGSYFATQATDREARFRTNSFGLFGDLEYRLRPSLTILAGVRFERANFPRSAIDRDTAFTTAFGIKNDGNPSDEVNLGPRLGVMWEGGPRREWQAAVVGLIEYGALNPARFAEATIADGGLTVTGGSGVQTLWPNGANGLAPNTPKRVTLFSPYDQYRDPRTTRLEADLRRRVVEVLMVRVSGGYSHTDYLLRRSDMGLLPLPTGITQEGREVYGILQQSGGMVAPAFGSNRPLPEYDLISGLTSTSYQDVYRLSIGAEGTVGWGVSVQAGYTYSRTRDNWLVSWSGDPSDELSPFPIEPVTGGWAKGVSDFDVPHRLALAAQWRSHGRLKVTVSGRYRRQSGMPFTPGFPPGVDVNGDGSGRNDPAFIETTIPGMATLVGEHSCLEDQVGEFAARNSCREPSRQALDLHAAVGLPLRSLGADVQLTLTLLNVSASRAGVIDRAAVLIDPAGTLTTDAFGNISLPLLANPHFGKYLSRRDEPRLLLIGLRLGNR